MNDFFRVIVFRPKYCLHFHVELHFLERVANLDLVVRHSFFPTFLTHLPYSHDPLTLLRPWNEARDPSCCFITSTTGRPVIERAVVSTDAASAGGMQLCALVFKRLSSILLINVSIFKFFLPNYSSRIRQSSSLYFMTILFDC